MCGGIICRSVLLHENIQFKKTLTDPDKMEAARKAFLESDEWQDTFDDPDLKAMASGTRVCVRLESIDWWACVVESNAWLYFIDRSIGGSVGCT